MPSILNIPKVIKQSASSQAVDVLRNSIIGGDIPAGARITETQLAEEMDLSRATVRAALHQLAREGLTTLVPYTGWTVVSLTPKDVWELYTLRSSLERLAAQLVASTLDEHKREVLGARYQSLAESCTTVDEQRIAEADFAFHWTIIDLSGHERLKTQYKVIERQIRIYIRSSDSLVEDASVIIEQHRPIAEAILAGDIGAAGQLSEAHNMTEGEKLTAHLQSLDSRTTGHRPGGDIGRLKNLKVRRRPAAHSSQSGKNR